MNKDNNGLYSNSLIRQITNLVAIIAAFGINVFVNINPPNGLTIGDISNQLFSDVLITPANYAFAVWGVIYLGLISFAIYQVLPSQKDSSLLQRLGYKIAIASLAQILWVAAFLSQQFVLSLLLMLIILGALITGYISLQSQVKSLQQKWLVVIPVSIYLAWISLATIVNVATVLDYLNWSGWGITQQNWTVLLLLVVGIIGIIVATQKNLAFIGVYIWALIAIANKNSSNNTIMNTANIIALILGITSISIFFLHRFRISKTNTN